MRVLKFQPVRAAKATVGSAPGLTWPGSHCVCVSERVSLSLARQKACPASRRSLSHTIRLAQADSAARLNQSASLSVGRLREFSPPPPPPEKRGEERREEKSEDAGRPGGGFAQILDPNRNRASSAQPAQALAPASDSARPETLTGAQQPRAFTLLFSSRRVLQSDGNHRRLTSRV